MFLLKISVAKRHAEALWERCLSLSAAVHEIQLTGPRRSRGTGLQCACQTATEEIAYESRAPDGWLARYGTPECDLVIRHARGRSDARPQKALHPSAIRRLDTTWKTGPSRRRSFCARQSARAIRDRTEAPRPGWDSVRSVARALLRHRITCKLLECPVVSHPSAACSGALCCSSHLAFPLESQ